MRKGNSEFEGVVSGLGVGRQLFTADGTFTVPTGVSKVFVTLLAGGGAGGSAGGPSDAGGGGASGGYITNIPYIAEFVNTCQILCC